MVASEATDSHASDYTTAVAEKFSDERLQFWRSKDEAEAIIFFVFHCSRCWLFNHKFFVHHWALNCACRLSHDGIFRKGMGLVHSHYCGWNSIFGRRSFADLCNFQQPSPSMKSLCVMIETVEIEPQPQFMQHRRRLWIFTVKKKMIIGCL